MTDRIGSFEEFLRQKLAAGQAPVLAQALPATFSPQTAVGMIPQQSFNQDGVPTGMPRPQAPLPNPIMSPPGVNYSGGGGGVTANDILGQYGPVVLPQKPTGPEINPVLAAAMVQSMFQNQGARETTSSGPSVLDDKLYQELVSQGETPERAMQRVLENRASLERGRDVSETDAALSSSAADSGSPLEVIPGAEPTGRVLDWSRRQTMNAIAGGAVQNVRAWREQGLSDEEIVYQLTSSAALQIYMPFGIGDASPEEQTKFLDEFLAAYDYGYTAYGEPTEDYSVDFEAPMPTVAARFEPGAEAAAEYLAGKRHWLQRGVADTAFDPFTWFLPGAAKLGEVTAKEGFEIAARGAARRAEGEAVRGGAQQIAGSIVAGSGKVLQAPNAILNTAADNVMDVPIQVVKSTIGAFPGGNRLVGRTARGVAQEGVYHAEDVIRQSANDLDVGTPPRPARATNAEGFIEFGQGEGGGTPLTPIQPTEPGQMPTVVQDPDTGQAFEVGGSTATLAPEPQVVTLDPVDLAGPGGQPTTQPLAQIVPIRKYGVMGPDGTVRQFDTEAEAIAFRDGVPQEPLVQPGKYVPTDEGQMAQTRLKPSQPTGGLDLVSRNIIPPEQNGLPFNIPPQEDLLARPTTIQEATAEDLLPDVTARLQEIDDSLARLDELSGNLPEQKRLNAAGTADRYGTESARELTQTGQLIEERRAKLEAERAQLLGQTEETPPLGEQAQTVVDETLDRPVGSFMTARGSTYEVTGAGTTIRTRTAPNGTSETLAESQATVYLPSDESIDLAVRWSDASTREWRFDPTTGELSLRTGSGPDAVWSDPIQTQTSPAVGLSPVELTQNGRGMHVGNEIVSVEPRTQAVVDETLAPDVTGTTRLYGVEGLGSVYTTDISLARNEAARLGKLMTYVDVPTESVSYQPSKPNRTYGDGSARNEYEPAVNNILARGKVGESPETIARLADNTTRPVTEIPTLERGEILITPDGRQRQVINQEGGGTWLSSGQRNDQSMYWASNDELLRSTYPRLRLTPGDAGIPVDQAMPSAPHDPYDWIPEGVTQQDLDWMDPRYTSSQTGNTLGEGNLVQHVVTELNSSPEYREAAQAFGKRWAPEAKRHVDEILRLNAKRDFPSFDAIRKIDKSFVPPDVVAEEVRHMGETLKMFREAFGEMPEAFSTPNYTFKYGDELIADALPPVDDRGFPIKVKRRTMEQRPNGDVVPIDPNGPPPDVTIAVLELPDGRILPPVSNIKNVIEHGAFSPNNRTATDARKYLRDLGMNREADAAKAAREKAFGLQSLSKSAQAAAEKARGVQITGKAPDKRATVPGNDTHYVTISGQKTQEGMRYWPTLWDKTTDPPTTTTLTSRSVPLKEAEQAARDALAPFVTPADDLPMVSMSSGMTPPTAEQLRAVGGDIKRFYNWAMNKTPAEPGPVPVPAEGIAEGIVPPPGERLTQPNPADPSRQGGDLRTVFQGGLSNENNLMLDTPWISSEIEDAPAWMANPERIPPKKRPPSEFEGMTLRQVFSIFKRKADRIKELHDLLSSLGHSADQFTGKRSPSRTTDKLLVNADLKGIQEPGPQRTLGGDAALQPAKDRLARMLDPRIDPNEAMAIIEAEWGKFATPGKTVGETDAFELALHRSAYEYGKFLDPSMATQMHGAVDFLHFLAYRLPRHLLLASPITSWTYTMRNVMSNLQMQTAAHLKWLASGDLVESYKGTWGNDFAQDSIAAEMNQSLYGSKRAQTPSEFGRASDKLDEATQYGPASRRNPYKSTTPTERFFTESHLGEKARLPGWIADKFEGKRNLDRRIERTMKIAGGYAPLLKVKVAEQAMMLRDDLIPYAAKNGIPVTALDIEDTIWSLRDTNGMFNHNDVYDGIYRLARMANAEEDVSRRFADRAARNWTNRAKTADLDAIAETNRIYPSNLKQTNLDHYLSYISLFHFWPTRSFKFMVEEMIRHPQLAVMWWRAHNGLERMAEEGDYPDVVKGLIRLGASPFGAVLYANPATLFLVTALQPDVNQQDPRDNATKIGEWLTKIRQKTGLQPVPYIDATLNVLGVYGDEFMPDIFPSRDADLLLKAMDASLVYSGHHMHTPVWDQTMMNVREFITSHTPGTGTVDAGNATGYSHDLIASEILRMNPDLQARMQATQPDGKGGTRPTPDAAAAMEEFWSIMDAEDDPRYVAAEKHVSANALYTQAINLVNPFTARANWEERSRTIQAAKSAREKADKDEVPTTKEEAARNLRTFLTDSPESQQLSAQHAADLSVGTEEQRQIQDGWTTIAYATPHDFAAGEAVWVDGKTYYPTDLMVMSRDDRMDLADQWVEEKGYDAQLEEFRALRDENRAKLPEYTAYLDWANAGRDYEGGVAMFRQEMSRISPGYKHYIDSLPADVLANPADLDRMSVSMDAYTSSRGQSTSIYDQPPGDALDISAVSPEQFLPGAKTESSSGFGTGKKEPKTAADLLEDFTKTRDDYQGKLETFNKKVRAITGGPGWEDLAPMWQESLQKRLAREGIDVPSKPEKLRIFEEWAGYRAEQGLSTDPMAFVQWLIENNPELLAVAA